MRSILIALLVVCGPNLVRAQDVLVAKYDWQNGTTDVSGYGHQDGVLDEGARIEGGEAGG